jgi:mono/diheme cytochrome c family protein
MRWTSRTALVALIGSVVVAALAISCANQQQSQQAAAPAMSKVDRGKYLVSVLGCMDCHTPGSLYGFPDTTRMLSGSELGWTGPWGTTYPRNLTPDSTGIGSWSENDIVTAIRTGVRPDHTPLLPPMPWPMYSHLTDDDAAAVAAYLKSIPPVSHHNPARLAPGAKAPAALVFPPPSAWDGKNLPPPPASPAATK